MPEALYRGRRAAQIENDRVRVTVLVEGGHIAEILDKASGVNPLWTPPWPSIEPSAYDRARHPEYGDDAEAKLLAGIMGHNLCLDVFGPPSPEEAAAGLTVHGEASIVPYRIGSSADEMVCVADLRMAQLRFERRLKLEDNGVRITETVENLSALDRPIAWTQHVTLGPPFLEHGVTEFRMPSVRSLSLEGAEGPGEAFTVFTSAPISGGYTAHLMDPGIETAFFRGSSPKRGIEFGYEWRRSDFPWLGVWEENHSRQNPPWNGRTLTRGMEFGVSPVPEPRRKMIERGYYRWIPARRQATVDYRAFIQKVAS